MIPAEPAVETFAAASAAVRTVASLALRHFDAPAAVVLQREFSGWRPVASEGEQAGQLLGELLRHTALFDQGDPLVVVTDLDDDPRMHDAFLEPAVPGAPRVRFLAAAVHGPAAPASALCLCLLDVRPRQFRTEDRKLLAELAETVAADFWAAGPDAAARHRPHGGHDHPAPARPRPFHARPRLRRRARRRTRPARRTRARTDPAQRIPARRGRRPAARTSWSAPGSTNSSPKARIAWASPRSTARSITSTPPPSASSASKARKTSSARASSTTSCARTARSSWARSFPRSCARAAGRATRASATSRPTAPSPSVGTCSCSRTRTRASPRAWRASRATSPSASARRSPCARARNASATSSSRRAIRSSFTISRAS